jgi:hypothetical protein
MSTQIPTPSDFPMRPPAGPTPEIEDVVDEDEIHVPDDEQPETGEADDDFPNR